MFPRPRKDNLYPWGCGPGLQCVHKKWIVVSFACMFLNIVRCEAGYNGQWKSFNIQNSGKQNNDSRNFIITEDYVKLEEDMLEIW